MQAPKYERSKNKMVQTNIPKFLTIRETAATGILSEHHLRLMAKRNELP